jgi:hypothetical protein
MSSNKLLLAGLAFLGGAVLGRLFGLKPLWRGALMAASVATSAPGALALRAARRTPARRTPARRATRARAASKRSRAA